MRAMRWLLLLAISLGIGALPGGARGGESDGARCGRHVPPLYQRWFSEYDEAHPQVQINYQALGSGAGIKQFTDGLVDFGASDAAMTDEEIAAVLTRLATGAAGAPATVESETRVDGYRDPTPHWHETRPATAGRRVT